MDKADLEHIHSLLAIYRRRIAITERKIARLYGGVRERLPTHELIGLEDDEAKVRELEKEVGR